LPVWLQMKDSVEATIRHMQSLQGEFADDDVSVFEVLGRGGFGIVYHGALHPYNSTCLRLPAAVLHAVNRFDFFDSTITHIFKVLAVNRSMTRQHRNKFEFKNPLLYVMTPEDHDSYNSGVLPRRTCSMRYMSLRSAHPILVRA
jgi:hypothetical protein